MSRLLQRLSPGLLLLWGATLSAAEAPKVDFNREIRPLLSANCYQCHGPDADQRKAKLRLDTRQGALAPREDHRTVFPGKPTQSELFRRITSGDPDERMPPPDSKKTLTPAQVELIGTWIREGAQWQEHWAWVTPQQPAVPFPADYLDFVRTPIDRFVLERLYAEQLVPSSPADRVTLVRRLYLDLLGLPPTPTQVAAFVNDAAPRAWPRLVDRLLESPHYGERMAIYWLDVVRYADSNGYHSDKPRQVAPYRDYVINAFNTNLRYDRFVIEQLAGDLLPKPTDAQRVASGFNMLLQTTDEGGAQAKEYLAKYSADRVRNTSSIFLGVTMGCAQCHDHKYDPFTMRDFYSLAAFFADVKEVGVGSAPAYPVRTPRFEKALQDVEAKIAAFDKTLARSTPALEAAQAKWEAALAKQTAKNVTLSGWHLIGPFPAANFEEAHTKAFPPETEIDLKKTYAKLKWVDAKTLIDGKVHTLTGQNCATYLFRTVTTEKPRKLIVSLGSDDSFKLWLNGKAVLEKKVLRGVAADQDKATLDLVAGENRLLLKIANGGGGYGFYFRSLQKSLPAPIVATLKVPAATRNAAQRKLLSDHYRGLAPLLHPVRTRRAAALKQKADIEKSLPRSLMTVSVAPRAIRILPRGNWMDDSGPAVIPAVPAFLPPLAVAGRRANRLDLARWVVSPSNPLTARAFVNRLWKLFHGQGLASPLDDLGAQGTRPTHPELLDWLALEFIKSNWNVKHMVRLIVDSGAYRQSSLVSPSLLKRDPYNRLLARQSRFRLDAEIVRDNALSISGLLSLRIGGPSVKPYQPSGYWRHMNFPARSWKSSSGDNLYRRGLYTHWQRMFLHPGLLAFDAPSREECTVERPRSNTPQQALVLLNDPTYVEAARIFAQRIVVKGGSTTASRLDWAFQQALSRDGRPREHELLKSLLDKHLQQYREDAQATTAVLSVGQRPQAKTKNAAELAAWTSIARIILNLHETITRS